MAGRQVHAVQVRHVPGRNDDAARVGLFLDLADYLLDLVNVAAVIIGPRTPLVTVDVAQASVGISPLVPNAHAVFVEVVHVRVAPEEPEEFVDNGLEMEFLGGEERETLGQVETHLVAEDAFCPSSRAVALHRPFVKDAAQEVEILLHGAGFGRFAGQK